VRIDRIRKKSDCLRIGYNRSVVLNFPGKHAASVRLRIFFNIFLSVQFDSKQIFKRIRLLYGIVFFLKAVFLGESVTDRIKTDPLTALHKYTVIRNLDL
jgi:hypothetical protein